MSSRTSRIERLVAVRSRSVDLARTALGAAQRTVRAAAEAADAADRTWRLRAEEVAVEAAPTVDALLLSRAHLEGLRRAADVAAEKVVAARRDEEVAREACVRADRELKKMETWRDNLASAQRAESGRRERALTDEAGARTFARART